MVSSADSNQSRSDVICIKGVTSFTHTHTHEKAFDGQELLARGNVIAQIFLEKLTVIIPLGSSIFNNPNFPTMSYPK